VISAAVMSEIVIGRLRAIVADMARVLADTAHSDRISVRRQFGCAVIDADGRVAAADNLRYVASLAATTQHCVEAFRFDLAEDDVILTNDPYGGSPSVHYFTVVRPVKFKDQTLGYVAAQAHMADIGGWVMGNYDPSALELRTEGTRFTPMKIIRFGRARRDILETVLLNSRKGQVFEGDLNGMLAAIARGQRQVVSMSAVYGAELVRAGMEDAIAYCARRAKAALALIPEGRYPGRAMIRTGDQHYEVEVVLERTGERTVLDFSNSDSQAPTFLNCVRATTETQALIPLLSLLDEDLPWNSGIFQAVEIVTRPGTVVAPAYPAPTGWSLDHAGSEVSESVRQAMAAALPEVVPPGMPNHDLAFTVRRERRVGSVEEQLGVTDLSVLARPGTGASHRGEGWGLPGPEALGMMPSVEEFEHQTALTVHELEYRCDSGGPGAARGGMGTTTLVGFPETCHEHLYAVAAATCGGQPGVKGGRPGGSSALHLSTRDDVESLTGIVTNLAIPGGAILRIDSAGGGGYGDPHNRPRSAVEADVLDGLVSAGAASSEYGVDVRQPRSPADALAGPVSGSN
jgi:N-methylhydantoinase B